MSQLHLRIAAIFVVLFGTLLVAPSAGAAVSDDTVTKAGVRFTLLSTTVDESVPALVAMNGAIHAKGTVVIVDRKTDRFELPDGTITVVHKRKKGSASESYDQTTCLFSFRERGTWRVTEGTGAYANASGSGTYRAQGGGFACAEDTPPEAFFSHVVAKGDLRY